MLGSHGWIPTDILLADIWAALTGKPHPHAPGEEGPPQQAHKATVIKLRERQEFYRRRRKQGKGTS